MASTLSALVTSSPDVLRAEVGSAVRIVDLPQGMALLPLTEQVRDAILPPDDPGGDDDSYLTPSLAAVAREWSRTVPLAYIESETHGGTGTQIAVIWRDGDIVWGPRYTANNEPDSGGLFVFASQPAEYAINAALRELGVDATSHHDEYAALGLHLKRHTEDWLA